MQDIIVKAYGSDKAFKTYDKDKQEWKDITVTIKMPALKYTLKGKYKDYDLDDDGEYKLEFNNLTLNVYENLAIERIIYQDLRNRTLVI